MMMTTDNPHAMNAKTLEISKLAAYTEYESQQWREWFAKAPPEVLDLPLGPNADGDIRTLIKHIFAVELRYAQRLVGDNVSAYEDLADNTVDDLWNIQHKAVEVRNSFLADASDDSMNAILISDTRKLGRIESRAHTVLIHSLMHSIRHWAQIALVLRQHGHGGLWEHDWLLSPPVQ